MLSLRPVTPADRPAVLDICATVWNGEDYLPNVFDEWLTEPHGQFTAAELDGRVVALAKLTRLAQGEYWLEGIRVHGAVRGRGLAAALHDCHLGLWRAWGEPGTLRLLTGVENQPIVKLCERTGFCSLFKCSFVEAAAASGAHRFAAAAPTDGEHVFELVTHAPLWAEQHGLGDLGWRWKTLTRDFLDERLKASAVYRWGEWEGALLVADENPESGSEALVIQFVAAAAEQFGVFCADLRLLAGALGKAKASWMLPHRPARIADLAPLGYSPPWSEPDVFHCFEIRQG